MQGAVWALRARRLLNREKARNLKSRASGHRHGVCGSCKPRESQKGRSWGTSQGSFPRDEAVEEVREFDAVQVFNWTRKSDGSPPGEFCFSNRFHRSHWARIVRVRRKQWQPERKSNALWEMSGLGTRYSGRGPDLESKQSFGEGLSSWEIQQDGRASCPGALATGRS